MITNKVIVIDGSTVLQKNENGKSDYLIPKVRLGYIDLLNAISTMSRNYHFYSTDGRRFEIAYIYPDIDHNYEVEEDSEDWSDLCEALYEVTGQYLWFARDMGLKEALPRKDTNACLSDVEEVDDVPNAMLLSGNNQLNEIAKKNGFKVFDPREYGYNMDLLRIAIQQRAFDGWEMDPQFGDLTLQDLVPIDPAGSMRRIDPK